MEFRSVGSSVVSKLNISILAYILPVGLNRSDKGYIPEMCRLGYNYC
jgi:hypothetical protein